MSAPKFIRDCQTDSERAFYPYLEALCLERGWDLTLHHQIGPYFPDFCIIAQKLVIEIDGGVHSRPYRMAQDIKRNSYLRKKGWVTLRFTNDQVQTAPTACISTITDFIRSNLILAL